MREKLKLKKSVRDSVKIRQLFPNSVTMLALAFGVSSLNMAYWGQWERAMLFTLLAAIFDFLDGKVARLLGVSSRFGMELDSLSDFVSFGVAPAFLMYQWTLDPQAKIQVMENIANRVDAVGIGWGLVLFTSMCCAMRLARFNTASDEKTAPYWKYFFTGVPAPAGALLTTFPLLLSFVFPAQTEFFRNHYLVAAFLIFSSFMMISRTPTFSLKYVHLPAKMYQSIRLILVAFIAMALCRPWQTLCAIGTIYILSIPAASLCFYRIKKQYPQEKEEKTEEEATEDTPDENAPAEEDSADNGTNG